MEPLLFGLCCVSNRSVHHEVCAQPAKFGQHEDMPRMPNALIPKDKCARLFLFLSAFHFEFKALN